MSEEKKNIHEALVAIMADVQSIGKNSKNIQQGFMYRGIDTIIDALHPHFVKHGVVILPEVIAERSEERTTAKGGHLIYRILTIRFHFAASDGSEACCVMIGESMDSGDKASNKAMAVGLKYALSQMLLLPYNEVDPDAESHKVEPKAPINKVTSPKGKVESDVQSKKPTAAMIKFLTAVGEVKAEIGAENYYQVLGNHGAEHATDLTDKPKQVAFWKELIMVRDAKRDIEA